MKMDRKSIVWSLVFVLGFCLVASFTIQHNHFTSGICGLLGCGLLVSGYVGLHWQQYQDGDEHTRRAVKLLTGLCLLLLTLNIISWILG